MEREINFQFTNKEYNDYVEKVAPKSKIVRNVGRAFVVGGIICVIGQMITNALKSYGLDGEMASGTTSVIMVFLGAFLTALNIYDEIGRYAGAGSIVPITGFANSIVSPAMEFKTEGYITGVGAKMFTIAGPVLVFGLIASIAIGILQFIFH